MGRKKTFRMQKHVTHIFIITFEGVYIQKFSTLFFLFLSLSLPPSLSISLYFAMTPSLIETN